MSRIEEQVEESLDRIRRHPFITGAHENRLSREQATRWVYCAGRESRTFPKLLEELVEWTENETVRGILGENLDDELGNGNPQEAHFMHYLHLLGELGISTESFYGYEELSGIKLALSLAFNVAKTRDEGFAIGYMLVNEAITPVTYEAARAALTRHFPGLTTDFFDLHIEVDDHHVAELYRAVEALSEPEKKGLEFGVSIGERGMAVLLDEAYGVFDRHRSAIDVASL